MTRWLREWSARIEVRYAGIEAQLAVIKTANEPEQLRAGFARVKRLRREMAVLHVEAAMVRMLYWLHLAALRTEVTMLRTMLGRLH